MNRINIAQQVSQRDAPPVGGFETQFLIKVRWLRFAFVGGAPLTVTLGSFNQQKFFKETIVKYVIHILALVTLSGCASIAGNSSYPVTLNSSPSEAKFVISNKDGQEVHSGITPSTVTLKSSAGYFDGEMYSVKYAKEGYSDSYSSIDSSLSGWYFGNILFGGILGFLIIDPASGAMWKLPENDFTSLAKKYTTKN